MQQSLFEVIFNEAIARNIFELKVKSPTSLEDFAPGNFLHIKISDDFYPMLRRPMSIANIEGNILTIIYRQDGIGTQKLSQKQAGEFLDILAPLGTAFELSHKSNSRVLLVGGGIGVPPLYYLGLELKKRGHQIKSLLGFNSSEDIFYENNFASLGSLLLTTMDASYGKQGLVTDYIQDDYDVLYSCGPSPMLRKLQSIIPQDKPAYMSIEERMACGIGACLACVCKVKNQDKYPKAYIRACTEGPVLSLHDVII